MTADRVPRLHSASGPERLRAWRCYRCARVLAHLFLRPGSVVIVRCRRCREYNRLAIADSMPETAST